METKNPRMGLPCGGFWWMPGLFLFGVCPVPEHITDSLPQLDGGPVPCHRPEAGDWLASFQHDGNDCHLCGFPPSSPCGCLGCADCALHVSSSTADFELVAADLLQDAGEARHGFTVLSGVAGVRMCPPCNPYSPRRSANSAPGGKLFSQSSGIAQERPGACSVISGAIVDSRGISGAAIGMRGYVGGYGSGLGINDMETEKPPQGLPCGGWWCCSGPLGISPAGAGLGAHRSTMGLSIVARLPWPVQALQ